MEPETIAGHRFSEGRARFNRAATLFLVLCGLNGSIYVLYLRQAIASGTPVSIYESHAPNVLSLKGTHVRVAPEVYRRIKTYGNITGILLAASFVLKLFLAALNARLSPSTAPDPSDELGPIRITGDGVAHSGGGAQWPVVLPRSQIERLELEHKPALERPLTAVVFGALFVLLGLTLAALLLLGIENFEMLSVVCLGFLLAGTGAWVLWLALKKRYVLIAHTSIGRSKMLFPPTATPERVIRFTTDAARRHGYPFDFGQGVVG